MVMLATHPRKQKGQEMAVIAPKSAPKVIRSVLLSLNETDFTPKSVVVANEGLIDQDLDAVDRVIQVMADQGHVVADQNGALKLTGSGAALLAAIPNRRTS